MNQIHTQSGFTLIEMIVSLAVFTTVIGISVGALLMLIGSNKQLQDEQSVMTNLSFALDSMTREIRTGVNYFCDSRPNVNAGPDKIFDDNTDLDVALNSGSVFKTQDCYQGNKNGHRYHGLAFSEGGDSITGTAANRILYYFDSDEGKIYRRVGDQPAQSIVSSGIYITEAQFYVTGSLPLSDTGVGNKEDQTAVTIFIEAKDINDPNAKAYQIQTTVTQRTIDI